MQCIAMRGSLALLLVACGTDAVPRDPNDPVADAPPPPGTPLITVRAPLKAEAFYVTTAVGIEWTVEDESASVTCDVTASRTSGSTPIAIATDVVATTSATATATWATDGVTPAIDYVVTVACGDDGTPPLVGTAKSGEFVISPPPEPVTYTEVASIFAGSCTSAPCHDNVQPQQSLDLTASAGYAELVGVASTECGSVQLVAPNQPSASYLVHKLQGSGTGCFVGTKMPKPPSAITATQVQKIRDWIQLGAPNN